jgi:hypothetical protein
MLLACGRRGSLMRCGQQTLANRRKNLLHRPINTIIDVCCELLLVYCRQLNALVQLLRPLRGSKAVSRHIFDCPDMPACCQHKHLRRVILYKH